MKHNIAILKMRAGTIVSICFAIALIASCPISAKADISDQHVTDPSNPPTYAEEITAPYIVSSPL